KATKSSYLIDVEEGLGNKQPRLLWLAHIAPDSVGLPEKTFGVSSAIEQSVFLPRSPFSLLPVEIACKIVLPCGIAARMDYRQTGLQHHAESDNDSAIP